MRVVLDTNVLVSALLSRGASDRLLRLLYREHTLVSSVALLDELIGVLSRASFKFTTRQIEEYLSYMCPALWYLMSGRLHVLLMWTPTMTPFWPPLWRAAPPTW